MKTLMKELVQAEPCPVCPGKLIKDKDSLKHAFSVVPAVIDEVKAGYDVKTDADRIQEAYAMSAIETEVAIGCAVLQCAEECSLYVARAAK